MEHQARSPEPCSGPNRTTPFEIKSLTWNDIRFPLPERPGLSESLLLGRRRSGVYIIEKMNNGRSQYTVRIGSGDIYNRLRAHRIDRNITDHGANDPWGSLRAFWAWVDPLEMRGVEKYLAHRLRPDEGERYPKNVPTIRVSLPVAIEDRLLGYIRLASHLAGLGTVR